MGCSNCGDKWRIILATESLNHNIMGKSNKPAEAVSQEVSDMEVNNPVFEAPKQVIVPSIVKPDINKVIEERRKVIEQGKIVNK